MPRSFILLPMEGSLLDSLSAHWDSLLREGMGLIFHKGQVLFYEGHTPYGIFVLQKGKVGFSEGEIACRGDHLIPTPHGSVIGVSEFFNKIPYCCTCTTTEDCTVIFVSKTQLLPLKIKEIP